MDALRAQINPHFMSNSLNAIENLVNMGKSQDASKYLIHFSRFTRRILTGSRHAVISLKDELKTLEHFLALEQLRFRDKLTYDIQVAPDVESDQVRIPSHGSATLCGKFHHPWHQTQTNRRAYSNQSRKARTRVLQCQIIDDGIGREKSRAMKKASVFQHKSMGMQITEDRLKAMGKIKGARVHIDDLTNMMCRGTFGDSSNP